MAITISGDGSITGLAVGGLPDGTVDNDTIAAATIADAKMASGGGKVLQVVQGTTTTQVSTSATTWIDSGLTASITPSSTSSKILVFFTTMLAVGSGADIHGGIRLMRGASIIQDYGTYTWGNYDAGENPFKYGSFSTNYLDSPSTVSATTYKYQGRNYSYGTFYMQIASRPASIVLIEIGA